jgi:hypothetical protein
VIPSGARAADWHNSTRGAYRLLHGRSRRVGDADVRVDADADE